jgi:hypothetical protein
MGWTQDRIDNIRVMLDDPEGGTFGGDNIIINMLNKAYDFVATNAKFVISTEIVPIVHTVAGEGENPDVTTVTDGILTKIFEPLKVKLDNDKELLKTSYKEVAMLESTSSYSLPCYWYYLDSKTMRIFPLMSVATTEADLYVTGYSVPTSITPTTTASQLPFGFDGILEDGAEFYLRQGKELGDLNLQNTKNAYTRFMARLAELKTLVGN